MRLGALLLAWTLTLCAGCAVATDAAEQATSDLVVIPRPAAPTGMSYFLLAGRPGKKSAAGELELANRGHRRLTVALAAVSGETLDTLGSTYATPAPRRRGPARWLGALPRRLSLAPGETRSVPVTVAVPRGARPGDYLAGISVEAVGQAAETSSVRGGASAAVTLRYAVGVETRLPGPRRPLVHFTGAELRREPSALTFLLDAANVGNVILQGVHGRVRISRDGRTVLSRPLPAGTFVTGSRIAYPVPAAGQHPPEGTRYRIQAWLRYRGGIARLDTGVVLGHRAAALARRYRAPEPGHGGGLPLWAGLALALMAIYGALVTLVLIRRRRRDRPAAGMS